MAYYCQCCDGQYTWSQQALTPGFCSTKCRSEQAMRQHLPKFKDVIQQKVSNKNFENYNSTDAVIPARDPAPVQRPNRCEVCLIEDYQGKPLQFVLTHLDGNTNNDRPSNLKLLCPNCSSQVKFL